MLNPRLKTHVFVVSKRVVIPESCITLILLGCGLTVRPQSQMIGFARFRALRADTLVGLIVRWPESDRDDNERRKAAAADRAAQGSGSAPQCHRPAQSRSSE